MPDNTIEILRNTIGSLRSLHKTIKSRRGELVQNVAGVEVEMVGRRIGAAIQQLQGARDLYTQLRGSDDVEQHAEPVTFETDWRGFSRPSTTEFNGDKQ
ncbi:MAG: hypothetical protein ACLQHF_11830 [Terracidiphilus sp.]